MGHGGHKPKVASRQAAYRPQLRKGEKFHKKRGKLGYRELRVKPEKDSTSWKESRLL